MIGHMMTTMLFKQATSDSIKYWATEMKKDPSACQWLSLCTDYDKWVNTLGSTRYVLEARVNEENQPVGFIEIDVLSTYQDAIINYYIHPNYRGQQLGTQLLNNSLRWLRENTKLHAIFGYVDYRNSYSLSALQGSNFLNQGRVTDFVVFSYILVREHPAKLKLTNS